MNLRFTTRSAEETAAAASAFAKRLRRGDCVALVGALGTGKTQFVKGVCREFGVHETVASPTFVLMNRYSGRDSAGREMLLYHFDLYRVRSADELDDLGAREFLSGDGISLVEWADSFPQALPPRRYEVALREGAAPDERDIVIAPVGMGAS